MNQVHTSFSTGLAGLDDVFTGLRPGDNVVWQVDDIADYTAFVHPFCREVRSGGRPLIYFRFAEHLPLLPEGVEAETHVLHPEEGFEHFISEIFDVIERVGIGGCYVFDCLSELAVDWYSDRMLGNFFMLTCPYLYTYETITYFALMRQRNTATAVGAIHGTAQIVLDVYRRGETRYIHPLKVYKRHSDTMYMLHAWQDERFVPVSESAVIADILARLPKPWLDFSVQRQDVWTRTFSEAQELLGTAAADRQSVRREEQLMQRLLRMAVTRDPRLLALARRYLTLADLVEVGKRMIGTGLIGGKSVGMLVARAILRAADARWAERLEAHDSFYIGTDVFYTYLVASGCWWVRRRLKDAAAALDSAQEARQRMLSGVFPRDAQDHFSAMLDYFGQSPIIVRSSSLLEDAYGNAFSGKYESVFCANQGTPEQRLEQFMAAVRTIYASTMSREALEYRMRWGLLGSDEQMALLVQRVSGNRYAEQYYPQVAGVAYSYNPFVWSSDIDPHAGFMRLVFGLGTRAVDRTDDDYTRIVSLSAPQRRPEASFDEVRKYSQRRVDVLDLRTNQHESRHFEDVAQKSPGLPMAMFASRDEDLERRAVEFHWSSVFSWVLTFEELLGATSFVPDMRAIVATLDKAYDYPVDVEFTANFTAQGELRINVLQCRPFQVKRGRSKVSVPQQVRREQTIFRSTGPIIGNSLATVVDRLVYVVPQAYAELKTQERHALARVVGRVAHVRGEQAARTIMLIGPGRWGTSTPQLGVPVSLADIDSVSVLCELAQMHEGVVPDVSLGTHFFNDIVELDMLYVALYPQRSGCLFSDELLQSIPNRLVELLPDAAGWAGAVRVLDSAALAGGKSLYVSVNAAKQQGICYLDGRGR